MKETHRGARTRTTLLLISAFLALANLPAEQFPLPWLAAFALPTALFGRLQNGAKVKLWVGAVFLTTQLAAILLTMRFFGPLPRVTSTLGCILIPMMVFLALRRGSHATLQALSLAFCLFLIGIILGNPSAWLCLGFLSTSTATMYFDASFETQGGRFSWRGNPETWLCKLSNLTSITATVVIGCFLMFQCLKLLPVPGQDVADEVEARKAASAASDVPSIGLSNQFDFSDDKDGTLLNLREEKILEVRSADGLPLARDLYLRYSYWDIASLSKWSRAGGRQETRQTNDTWNVKAPVAGAETRAIQIEFSAPSSPLVFAPPGLVQLKGLSNYNVDRELGFIQLPGIPSPNTNYRVRYQDLREFAYEAQIDTKWGSMTRLSHELERFVVQKAFLQILEEANVTPAKSARKRIDAIAVAEAITTVIQARCTYQRKIPAGPYGDQLLNFLEGERIGFCMHFASATAICLRMAGVPCRIGVGLLGGRETGDPRLREYGQQHAHAWVEIPMRDLGWVVFDPSPPDDVDRVQRTDIADLKSEDLKSDGLALDEETDSESLKHAIAMFTKPLDYPIVWIILAALIVLPFLGRRQTSEPTAPRKVRDPEAITARRLLGKIFAYLGRAGMMRRRGQSLESFASKLDREHAPTTGLTDAFSAYQEIRFGGRPFDEARRKKLERGVKNARELSDESRKPPRKT